MSFNNSNKAMYSCTALVGTNKAGTLKADADGYYTLVLGALNIHNAAGAFYPLESAKHLFDSSSSLIRRIETGNLRGECGHPKQLPGQNTRDYLQRILQIEETNICCHFRRVWLVDGKDDKGRNVVLVMGEVKPAGPRGPALKEALENKHENVCFSIRSLTKDHMNPAGFLIKNIQTIVCWDWVNEPGISLATKYKNPGLESIGDDVEILEEHLTSIKLKQERNPASMESSVLDIDTVCSEMGWNKPPMGKLPASANW